MIHHPGGQITCGNLLGLRIQTQGKRLFSILVALESYRWLHREHGIENIGQVGDLGS